MNGKRKLTEQLTEEERRLLFERIHRAPHIPDRHAPRGLVRTLPSSFPRRRESIGRDIADRPSTTAGMDPRLRGDDG